MEIDQSYEALLEYLEAGHLPMVSPLPNGMVGLRLFSVVADSVLLEEDDEDQGKERCLIEVAVHCQRVWSEADLP